MPKLTDEELALQKTVLKPTDKIEGEFSLFRMMNQIDRRKPNQIFRIGFDQVEEILRLLDGKKNLLEIKDLVEVEYAAAVNIKNLNVLVEVLKEHELYTEK